MSKLNILIIIIFSLALAMCLSACDNSSPPQPPVSDTPPTATISPSTPKPEIGEDSSIVLSEPENKVEILPVTLLYQGHGSLRFVTGEGKVIYVDPYAGEGYDLAADLILITHQHSDHNQLKLISSRSPGCVLITEKEALENGTYQIFDLGYVIVESVEANNKNHNPKSCVGFILAFENGLKVYISGDTSKTTQMSAFASKNLDYAILCCDGTYNMNTKEASECAELIGATHSIPYHMASGKLFDRVRAEQFEAVGRIIVEAGEEIVLMK